MATVNKTSVRVVTRLIEMGITTEKAVTSLELKDALAIPGITVADLHAVCELQAAIKGRKLFARTEVTAQMPDAAVISRFVFYGEKELAFLFELN